MKKCLAVAIFAIVAATKASAVGTASRVHLNALVEENARLKALNERLRTQVLKKVGGSAERLHKIAHASSSSFLETAASPEANGKGKKKETKPRTERERQLTRIEAQVRKRTHARTQARTTGLHRSRAPGRLPPVSTPWDAAVS